MASVIALIVIAVLVAGTAVVSAAAASVPLVPRGRVRRLVEMGTRGADSLDDLQGRASRTIAAAHLMAGVASAASTALVVWSLEDTYPALELWAAVLIGLGVSTVTVFAFGDALPRTLAVQNPEGVGLAASRVAATIVGLVSPLAIALSAPWQGVMRLVGGERAGLSPWSTEDEVRAHGPEPEDEEEAAREEAEERLLDAVADFTGKIVREVMVPRTDMTCLEDLADVADALALIEQHGYSRLPVFHETVDDIVGVLYAKDLLLQVGRGRHDVRAGEIARRAVFVPETKPVEELLLEMRNTTHIAIVADEYGGTAGLVTIEDLIEEIVGEIFDEYDLQVPLIVDSGDGRFVVDARLPIDDLNDVFGTAIEAEADTVGGLFSEVTGHIPAPGEELEYEGLLIRVVDLEGARIRHLDVGPAARPDEEEDEDAGDHSA